MLFARGASPPETKLTFEKTPGRAGRRRLFSNELVTERDVRDLFLVALPGIDAEKQLDARHHA
jgi:hypothetical protein